MQKSTIEMLIKNRVKEVIEATNKLFPAHSIDYRKLNYKMNLRGRTAGKASHSTMTLYFNLILAENNITAFLATTVPHEIAHLYQRSMFPRSKSHGVEWKSIMVKMGQEPKRCHNFDTQVITTNRRTFKYGCPCGKTFDLSSNMHTRIKKGSRRVCKRCSGDIYFIGENL